jgi:hypothetical protein
MNGRRLRNFVLVVLFILAVGILAGVLVSIIAASFGH